VNSLNGLLNTGGLDCCVITADYISLISIEYTCNNYFYCIGPCYLFGSIWSIFSYNISLKYQGTKNLLILLPWWFVLHARHVEYLKPVMYYCLFYHTHKQDEERSWLCSCPDYNIANMKAKPLIALVWSMPLFQSVLHMVDCPTVGYLHGWLPNSWISTWLTAQQLDIYMVDCPTVGYLHGWLPNGMISTWLTAQQ